LYERLLFRHREIVWERQHYHKILILIEHKTNKKQGVVRGKYVWFIDNYDFIAENCLKSFIEIKEKSKNL